MKIGIHARNRDEITDAVVTAGHQLIVRWDDIPTADLIFTDEEFWGDIAAGGLAERSVVLVTESSWRFRGYLMYTLGFKDVTHPSLVSKVLEFLCRTT
jgi:hypothetical protein